MRGGVGVHGGGWVGGGGGGGVGVEECGQGYSRARVVEELGVECGVGVHGGSGGWGGGGGVWTSLRGPKDRGSGGVGGGVRCMVGVGWGWRSVDKGTQVQG